MEEGHRDVVALLNRAALAKLVAGVRVTAQLPVSPPGLSRRLARVHRPLAQAALVPVQ